MKSLRTRTAITTFTGLSAIALLAGCASSADATGSTSGGATSGGATSSDSSSGGTTSTDSTTYKDGDYSEDGSYTSPGGTETINVKLTLKANVVTAVTVTTVKADATAASYEKQFIGGIKAEVVGKKINELKVSRVAGSSLTSQGFNAAVTKIKADAKG